MYNKLFNILVLSNQLKRLSSSPSELSFGYPSSKKPKSPLAWRSNNKFADIS